MSAQAEVDRNMLSLKFSSFNDPKTTGIGRLVGENR